MSKGVHRICIISIVLLSITLGLSPATAVEKGYPNKPITIVIEYPPGGGSDLIVRGLAKEMQASFGQPVLVESRPGASGIIAGDYVAKSKPDGYTIAAFLSAACDPDLFSRFRKATYTTQDLIPVVRYVATPYGLVSKKEAPWNNLSELFKYCRDNPNKVRWTHLGIGHRYHICGFMLARANNLEVIMVPFKGGGDTVIAVLGGHVEVGITSLASVWSHVQAGKLKILAVQHPERVSCIPEAPTLTEQGYDVGLSPYYMGLFMPKGSPEEAKKKIHDEVKRAVETPFLKDYAKQVCMALYYGTANDLLNDMKKDREVIGPLLDKISKQGEK